MLDVVNMSPLGVVVSKLIVYVLSLEFMIDTLSVKFIFVSLLDEKEEASIIGKVSS